MKTAPTIPQPANPALLDKAFAAINTKMLVKLDWLTNAFGKAQKLTRLNDKKREVKYPAVYTGTGKEYASMLPHEGYGNFSFWDVQKDYEIEWVDNQQQIIEVDFGLVFWMNLNTVLEASELRNLESIKEEVIAFFTAMRVPSTRIQLTGVTEQQDKIYQGYSTKEVESQYLMHPYAGLRFNGTIRYERLCNQ